MEEPQRGTVCQLCHGKDHSCRMLEMRLAESSLDANQRTREEFPTHHQRPLSPSVCRGVGISFEVRTVLGACQQVSYYDNSVQQLLRAALTIQASKTIQSWMN